jgi:uncharacterized protein (DUF2235 family)
VARNIVLCLDGTNNEYAATNTNVVKLYAMLDRTGNDQFTYYQPGIGTMPPAGMWGRLHKRIVKTLDLAIAWLLEEHVSDAYRFLMRYYEEGDRIYIFGFSRGAYTARVLAAMLYKVGLLSKGNEELVPFAWEMFTHKSSLDQEPCAGFRRTFAREVTVHFLGLWDTVSSVGWAWNPSHYQYTANNPSVTTIRHAVALDERRAYFVQNLWGSGADVEQVWFPGVHCDVGGGYPEGTLAVLALAWMTREAKTRGLLTDPITESALLPDNGTTTFLEQHANGAAHESLTGWWWVGEYLPRPIKVQEANKEWRTRWIVPAGRYRTVPPGSSIHQSILSRQKDLPSYRPSNLPANAITVS